MQCVCTSSYSVFGNFISVLLLWTKRNNNNKCTLCSLYIVITLYCLFRNLKVCWNHMVFFNSDFLYPWYAQYIIEMEMPGSERDILEYTMGYYDDSKDLQHSLMDAQLIGYSGVRVLDECEIDR